MTEHAAEVRVVCPHGTVATFVSTSVPGAWIINVKGAEWAPNREGVHRWHQPMKCDRCRLTVPVVNMDKAGPILDRLLHSDSPAITRTPNGIEVSLKLMADALGAARRLPE